MDKVLLLSDAYKDGFPLQPYTLLEKTIEFVFADQTRQYNGDETEFLLDPETAGMVVYTESSGIKEQVTVLITTQTDRFLATSAIFYEQTILSTLLHYLPEGFCAAESDSG